jgi:hypothetical protein
MGSAMSIPAADNGHEVRLVGTSLDREIIERLKIDGVHPKHQRKLPDAVRFLHIEELPQALVDADLLINGVSSFGVDWFTGEVLPLIPVKGLSPWLLRPPQVVCRRGRRLSEHITGIGGALWDRSGLPSVLEPIALAQWFHLSVLSGKRRMAGSASSLDLPSLPPSILSDRGHHL